MVTEFRKQLDDLIECSVCYEVYKEPRTLSCLHSFCLVCCEGFCCDKLPGDDVECPLCREEFTLPPNGVRGLRTNFVLEKLMQINQVSTSPQTVIDLTKKTVDSNVPSFCDKHDTKTIDWYCFKCKEAICTSCLTKNHKSHDVRDLEEVIDELQASLTTGVTDLQKKYEKYKLILDKIEKEEEEFVTHVQSVKTEIIEDAKRHQENIELSKSELLTEVSAKECDRLKEVNNMKQEIQQQMAFVISLLNYTTKLLKNGAANDVAREAKSLEKRTSKLLQSDEDKTLRNQLGILTLSYTPRLTQSSDVGYSMGSILPLKVTAVRSLSEGNEICGVTVLNKHLYVHHLAQYIAVYDTDTYSERRRFKVPGLGGGIDLTSCRQYQCIYISDWTNKSLHKVRVKETTGSLWDKCSYWPVNDCPGGLSVNSQYHLIVTCIIARKIKVFTTDGNLLKVIQLQQSYIIGPYHTIQLTRDDYVICHGDSDIGVIDLMHRVCIIDGSGKVKRSFGSKRGLGEKLLSFPFRMAVVNGLIFVADHQNGRVVMLNGKLGHVGNVNMMFFTSDYRPFDIWSDEATSRVYVSEGKFENGKWTTWQVSVYGVSSR